MTTRHARDVVATTLVGYLLAAIYLAAPLMPSTSWFEPGSLSFELVKGLPAAFVALVIGLVAAWIAYQQYRVGRAKFKLDLFDKRYHLYDTLWTFLSTASDNLGGQTAESIELSNSIPSAYFLFGKEIGDFFRLAQNQQSAYRRAMSKLVKMKVSDPGRADARASATELSNWFDTELSGLRARFSSHLSFEEWH